MWDREVGGEAGDPPPSCERLEVLCESTSGWAGGAERTDVRIGRITAQLKKKKTSGQTELHLQYMYVFAHNAGLLQRYQCSHASFGQLQIT